MSSKFKILKKRPIYKELTGQIIDTSADDKLLQIVIDNLCEKLPSNYDAYRTVLTWNKSRQAIYMIGSLEAEVNNGDYNQFYFTQSDVFINICLML